MGLTHISILQVGDVHFPDLVLAPPLADIKDKGFSSAAIEAIVPTRIAEITKGLDKLCRTEAGLLGVALTGDLTTQGSLKHYSECLEYLKGVFRRLCNIFSVNWLKAVPSN